jgi:hypothetical protein
VSYDENEVIEVSICKLKKVKVIEKQANKASFEKLVLLDFLNPFQNHRDAESKSVVC